MPGTIELADLDALIEDLDARITDTELPEAQAVTAACSGLCTVVICTLIVCA
ncbi:hypothetical protein [Streptomyces sp. NPDC015131]|uniref:hypothetical protein n=1 Tax=Streptomyces sp. NPDC015131 TaxID=3364941 RepID=UPI0037017DA2